MDYQKTPLAVAVFTAIIYVLCVLAVWLVPDIFRRVTDSWVHGLNLSTIWNPTLTTGSVVWGFITSVISAYISALIFVWVYKSVAK